MIRNLCFTNLQEDLQRPLRELEECLDFRMSEKEEADIYVTMNHSKHDLQVRLNEKNAEIIYHNTVELFRAVGLLMEYLNGRKDSKSNNNFEVLEKPFFTNLTYMQDNSRNAVSNIKSVKKMVRHLALMGYHSIMLYTEDTYEIEGYPFFGYMRGRFTKKELKEINDYAGMFGIEVIPCIQTLAHLNAPLQWKVFDEIKDMKDILLCGEPKTYELIEAMIKTCSETFTSRRINIGMDEAEMLGLGKYLRINGYKERFHIMLEHLHQVLSICTKYGMQAMMWSDMFFKLLSDKSDDYYAAVEISDQVKEMIPKNVQLIYWDYYSRDKTIYDQMFERHKQLTDHIGFAGGAWRWTGFAPLLGHSMETSKLALESCIEHGIKDVIVTCWGDDGSETSTFAVGPVLQLYAEACYLGNVSKKHVARRLESCTHMNYQDFLELDKLNLTPDNPAPGILSVAPSRYVFYQDLLMGLFDKHIDENTYPKHYIACYEIFGKIAKKENEYSYIFVTLEKFSQVLALKCDLGIRLKDAYDRKDKTLLKQIATKDCAELLGLIENFHEAIRGQWYLESKPFGFDVLDLRIGGLKERIRAAIWRIEEYLSGGIEQIEELEQERLLLMQSENPKQGTFPVFNNDWKTMITASVL